MTDKSKDVRQEMYVRQSYSLGSISDEERAVSEIGKFLERSLKLSGQTDIILNECVKLIHRISAFTEIAIGLKDEDGQFRYHEMLGFRKEAVDARKRIVYTQRDMVDGISYRAIRSGRFSQFHLAESEPYKPEEKETYNRPDLLGQPRASHDDMIEGDYLDIYIYGPQKEILGWLELSGTRHGKFPTRQDLLNLEFLASCLAVILMKTSKQPMKKQPIAFS